MSCSTMLGQILEADLDVLDGAGDSEVARHVRQCARCQAIARQIVGDTRSLAVAVADMRPAIEEVATVTTPARASRRNRGRIAALAGLAAALGVFVVREWPRRVTIAGRPPQIASVEPPRSDTRSLSTAPATMVAAPPVQSHRVRSTARHRPAPDTRETQRLVSAAPQVLATVAERTIVKPVGLPNAVIPVRIDTMTNVALGGTVAVDPPTGIRANIIRTPNPTVTVVWLYQ